MLNKTKTLTTIAIQKKAKEKALKQTSQIGKEPYENHSEKVVFLTVNHRGPLPLSELHSTGETIMWRDPGGS